MKISVHALIGDRLCPGAQVRYACVSGDEVFMLARVEIARASLLSEIQSLAI